MGGQAFQRHGYGVVADDRDQTAVPLDAVQRAGQRHRAVRGADLHFGYVGPDAAGELSRQQRVIRGYFRHAPGAEHAGEHAGGLAGEVGLPHAGVDENHSSALEIFRQVLALGLAKQRSARAGHPKQRYRPADCFAGVYRPDVLDADAQRARQHVVEGSDGQRGYMPVPLVLQAPDGDEAAARYRQVQAHGDSRAGGGAGEIYARVPGQVDHELERARRGPRIAPLPGLAHVAAHEEDATAAAVADADDLHPAGLIDPVGDRKCGMVPRQLPGLVLVVLEHRQEFLLRRSRRAGIVRGRGHQHQPAAEDEPPNAFDKLIRYLQALSCVDVKDGGTFDRALRRVGPQHPTAHRPARRARQPAPQSGNVRPVGARGSKLVDQHRRAGDVDSQQGETRVNDGVAVGLTLRAPRAVGALARQQVPQQFALPVIAPQPRQPGAHARAGQTVQVKVRPVLDLAPAPLGDLGDLVVVAQPLESSGDPLGAGRPGRSCRQCNMLAGQQQRGDPGRRHRPETAAS